MDRVALKANFPQADQAQQAALVTEALSESSSFRDYHFLDQLITAQSQDTQQTVRIALLSNYTIDPLVALLRVQLFSRGIATQFYVPGYNQMAQELHNPASAYFDFAADVTFICPSPPERQSAGSGSKIEEQAAEFLQYLYALEDRTHSRVILNTLYPPFQLAQGLLDHSDESGDLAFVRSLNQKLVSMAAQRKYVYICDTASLVSRFGEQAAYSAKLWFTSRIPFGSEFQIELTRVWAVMVASFYKPRKKCLVLDLDNTLWGGIVGEDGLSGIQVGNDYPGEVYSQIQRRVKDYADQGIILALNSKNNLKDAQEAFDQKSGMVLKWDDFAAVRVNWQPKPLNLKELSQELNIGLDSMVFVDDNPAEIAAVNQLVPEVETIGFNGSPIENLKRISELDSFLNLDLTPEDIQKTEQYRSQKQRQELQGQAASLDEFYTSLEMQAVIQRGQINDVARLTQLTQKTNQFNLTTRRYDELQMRQFLANDEWTLIQLRLLDRFGDNGITGLVMAQSAGDVLRIDNFLMSCRIIGRTAETALLAILNSEARTRGYKTLQGEYVPTAKNAPVKDFYPSHGFTEINGYWERSTDEPLEVPEWIEVRNA